MIKMRVFAHGGLNLREGPSLQSHVVRLLADDEKVEAFENSAVKDYLREWIKIQTSRGEVGYVADAYLVKEPNPPIVMLNVPYKSQEDSDARHFRNDCGTVCSEMVFEFLGKPPLSSDHLSNLTDLAKDDSGLFTIELSHLFEIFDIETDVVPADTDILRANLNSKKPIIALIWYGEILGRQSNYSGGHFVVVVGYGDDEVYINDPDFYGNRRKEGHQFRVPLKQWVKAQRQFLILK